MLLPFRTVKTLENKHTIGKAFTHLWDQTQNSLRVTLLKTSKIWKRCSTITTNRNIRTGVPGGSVS